MKFNVEINWYCFLSKINVVLILTFSGFCNISIVISTSKNCIICHCLIAWSSGRVLKHDIAFSAFFVLPGKKFCVYVYKIISNCKFISNEHIKNLCWINDRHLHFNSWAWKNNFVHALETFKIYCSFPYSVTFKSSGFSFIIILIPGHHLWHFHLYSAV